jgi:hypothetical protein
MTRFQMADSQGSLAWSVGCLALHRVDPQRGWQQQAIVAGERLLQLRQRNAQNARTWGGIVLGNGEFRQAALPWHYYASTNIITIIVFCEPSMRSCSIKIVTIVPTMVAGANIRTSARNLSIELVSWIDCCRHAPTRLTRTRI